MTVGIEHLIWMLDERLARAEQSAIDSRGAPNSYGHGYDEGFWEALVDARVMAETLLTKSDGGVEGRHAECPQGRSCARVPQNGHGTSGQATIAGVAPGPSDDALVLRRIIQQLSFNRAAGCAPDETTIRSLELLVSDIERRTPALSSNARGTPTSEGA